MHNDTLTEYLERVISNTTLPQSVKDDAQKILGKWNNGIIPSPKTLDKLAKSILPPNPCVRIQPNGACAWLRKYGEGYKLPVPPTGEPAICCYNDSFTKCPGYKK